jgi:5-deoxy-D-glucuronate isomerase
VPHGVGDDQRRRRHLRTSVALVEHRRRSLDETVAVCNGDVVLVARGYHGIAAAPGYELCFSM